MSRSCRAFFPWTVLLLFAAGCQSYNFNPVGACVIQPGSSKTTLSSISTADVLFVVDDSNSMEGEQAKLAAGFDLFIQNLDRVNALRATAGLQPIDFHIAVTTTSVFWNYTSNSTCRSDCGSAAGQAVCCGTSSNAPVLGPRACTPGSTQCPSNTSCSTSCQDLKGESYCCDTNGVAPNVDPIRCAREGSACGSLERHYDFGDFSSCASGTAADQWPFPAGDFVSWAGGTSSNPRVLHFDKQLYPGTKSCVSGTECAADERCVASAPYAGAQTVCRKSCTLGGTTCAAGYVCASPGPACHPTNRQGFTGADLIAAFKGGTFKSAAVNGNVVVGTCGSGEEQGLEAGELAVQKALSGSQKDTFDLAGTQTWIAATRTAGSAAEWPHDNSKLVLVFVGDEDDCSSPKDPSGGVVMLGEPPGYDACTRDAALADGDPNKKEFSAGSFADYFTNLGRPVGAAFVVSAAQSQCGYGSFVACTPGTCCQPDCPTTGQCTRDLGPNYCGGQAAGARFFDAAAALKDRGVPAEDVLVGSVCDPDFNTLLDKIAQILKMPTGLELPTLPAESDITVLRIANSDGDTVKMCGRPAPATLTADQAMAQGYDWWFTLTLSPTDPDPSEVTRYIYINPSGGCLANPGETYSAEYLGQLPAGGCQVDADCKTALGGTGDCSTPGSTTCPWTCYAGMKNVSGVDKCIVATASAAGTCICGSASETCKDGYTP